MTWKVFLTREAEEMFLAIRDRRVKRIGIEGIEGIEGIGTDRDRYFMLDNIRGEP